MPRELRICLPDTTNHVTSRCIDNKFLMRPNRMKDLMREVLVLTLEKYDFELVSYSLMDNHFHFIIKTLKDGETISRIMQFIKSQYARRYNRMMDRIGPFWNERFTNLIIERAANPVQTFWFVFMYVGYNPVKSKYVNDPRDYTFSSFKAYVDKDYVPPVPITLSEYFIKLGDSFEEQVKKLVEFEEQYRKRMFPGEIFA
jgi:putative transposase